MNYINTNISKINQILLSQPFSYLYEISYSYALHNSILVNDTSYMMVVPQRYNKGEKFLLPIDVIVISHMFVVRLV